MFERPSIRYWIQGILLLGGIGIFLWGWYYEPIEDPARDHLIEVGILTWTLTLYWVFSHTFGSVFPGIPPSVRGEALGLLLLIVGNIMYKSTVESLMSKSSMGFALIANTFWRRLAFQNKFISLIYMIRWMPQFYLLLWNTLMGGDKN